VQEAANALAFFSTDAGAVRFLALLFPGFIALTFYDSRVPSERRKWNEMGVTLVSYSLLIDVFAATYLQCFPLTSSSAKWQIICFGLIFNLIVPAVLGWIVVDIREWLAGEGRVLSAIPKAWDEFFKRIGNKPYGLVVTLKDGQKVGGFWAEKPFASSYPADEDLFIPVPVHIDRDGNFLERIEGAKGLLIARGDILMITAVDANVAAGTPATPAPKRGECKDPPLHRSTYG